MRIMLSIVFALMVAVNFAFAATDINTATQSELDKLPGIGPAKAKAIVEYRAKNGPFKSINDLKRVKGIGGKTFDELKGQISVGGSKASPMPAPAALRPTGRSAPIPAGAAAVKERGDSAAKPAAAAARPAAARPAPAAAKGAANGKPSEHSDAEKDKAQAKP
jgi:competence protein ComEA